MERQRHATRRMVLVALDGSLAAAPALPIARAMGRQLNAGVEAVHVASEAIPKDQLRGVLGLNRPDQDDVPLRVLIGDPVDELLRTTGDRRVVFLALATHGHSVEKDRPLARIPEALAA